MIFIFQKILIFSYTFILIYYIERRIETKIPLDARNFQHVSARAVFKVLNLRKVWKFHMGQDTTSYSIKNENTINSHLTRPNNTDKKYIQDRQTQTSKRNEIMARWRQSLESGVVPRVSTLWRPGATCHLYQGRKRQCWSDTA